VSTNERHDDDLTYKSTKLDAKEKIPVPYAYIPVLTVRKPNCKTSIKNRGYLLLKLVKT
jgi:hypothetical protein